MGVVDPKDVKLKTELPFERFLSPTNLTQIVSNQTFEYDWSKVCELDQEFEGVYKRVLPIDFREFCMLVVTKVAPGTTVPSHGHKEGIFRYILEGSLTLNGVPYRAGDWIVVPTGMPYKITTEEGYKAIAGYLQACDPHPEPEPGPPGVNE